MSESNYWFIKLKAKSKDGANLSRNEIQAIIKEAYGDYDGDIWFDEYNETFLDLLSGFDVDGDRFYQYRILLEYINDFKQYLEEDARFNLLLEIENYCEDEN